MNIQLMNIVIFRFKLESRSKSKVLIDGAFLFAVLTNEIESSKRLLLNFGEVPTRDSCLAATNS